MGNSHKRPDNNMVWAILCTSLCCLPLGIVSIIEASKVDGRYRDGDYEGAQEAADKAKKYAIIGAVIGLAAIIICIVVYVLAIIYALSLAHLFAA